MTAAVDLNKDPREGGRLDDEAFLRGFWFALPSTLRSKSNFRRSGRSSTWSALASFEGSIARAARVFRPPDWDVGDRDAKLGERPVVIAACFARTLIDAGNISKSILDAAQDVLYVNDASVRHESALSERARSDLHGAIAFAQLECGASLGEIARASWALERQLLAALGLLDP